MTGVIILALVLIVLIMLWRQEKIKHDKRIDNLKVRVHVNGIRGKSTVTRLVAGVLREAGLHTLGKTTGSAAKVIFSNGSEEPIQRRSAATIMEQVDIIRKHVSNETEALVVETMALRPINQKASQDLMVKGNITIITNVRQDHQDVMGESLEEIADTMSLTIPYNGILITAEDRPHLRERLRRNAEARGSRMIYANPAMVNDADMTGFTYLSFRENVAIGLVTAELLGIPRQTAVRGMWNARPDVGVVDIQRVNWQGKEIVWAPLFAVNDKESAIISLEQLRPFHKPNAARIGILNNRYDRAKRALQFAEIAAKDLPLDWWITFGAYEKQVTGIMAAAGYPREQIINLGFSVNPDLNQIMDTVAGLIKGDQGLLCGMVNIHTPQAELLMEFFHHLPDAPDHSDEELARRRYRPRLERLKERTAGRLGNPRV